MNTSHNTHSLTYHIHGGVADSITTHIHIYKEKKNTHTYINTHKLTYHIHSGVADSNLHINTHTHKKYTHHIDISSHTTFTVVLPTAIPLIFTEKYTHTYIYIEAHIPHSR